MLTSRDRIRSLPMAWPLLVALLLMGSPAIAQDDILVQTADPDMAEQATYDLEVMVGGQNFPSDAEVEFFVTGTTDNGGITVKKVKRQGPKNLKVTINVAEDAQFQLKYDIEVRSRGGRKGKGTELFRVTEKQHPTQDTTPPGMPLDLQVLDVSFGSVTLSWTMPADDGYDDQSGNVDYCWVLAEDATQHNPYWNCYSRQDDGGVVWPAPGETQVCWEQMMQPGTTYELRVTCRDDAGLWSPENQVEIQTLPFSADPSWSVEELPFPIGHLIGHKIDLDGSVIVAGIVVTRRGKGPKKPDETAVRVATGTWNESSGSWTWSYEDVDGVANRMLVDPQGGPVFAGLEILGSVNLPGGRSAYNRRLGYTFHDGAGWTTEVIAEDAGYFTGLPGFAFDPSGQPAIAWCYRSEGQPREMRLARRIGAGQWAVEAVSGVNCAYDSHDLVELTFDGQANPAILFNEILGPEGGDGVRTAWLASWSEEAGWSDEALTTPQDSTVLGRALLFDAWRGDFFVSAPELWLMRTCERTGASGWQCEEPFLGDHYHPGSVGGFGDVSGREAELGTDVLAQDSLGEVFMAFSTAAEYDMSLARRPPGATEWVMEHVDHFTTKFPVEVEEMTEVAGPFLDLDPSGLPTLSWTWNGVTYFAWKPAP